MSNLYRVEQIDVEGMLDHCFDLEADSLEQAAIDAARRLHGEQGFAVRDPDRSPGNWFKVLIEAPDVPVLTDTRLRLTLS